LETKPAGRKRAENISRQNAAGSGAAAWEQTFTAAGIFHSGGRHPLANPIFFTEQIQTPVSQRLPSGLTGQYLPQLFFSCRPTFPVFVSHLSP
jgi:hypothetical protein